jgi:hypothetical protein
MSRFIVVQLDSSYRVKAASPIMADFRNMLADKYEDVYVDGDKLKLRTRP